MVNWSGLANRKYDILQQNADANTSEANTKAFQAQSSAATNAMVAQSAIRENDAQANLLNTTAKSGRTPVGGSGGGPMVDTATIDKVKSGGLFSQAEEDRMGRGKGMLTLAKGIARVPGKGSPKVDTKPAMLAPGEAVLNAPAAKMIGRGLIAKANAKGRAKMGMA